MSFGGDTDSGDHFLAHHGNHLKYCLNYLQNAVGKYKSNPPLITKYKLDNLLIHYDHAYKIAKTQPNMGHHIGVCVYVIEYGKVYGEIMNLYDYLNND